MNRYDWPNRYGYRWNRLPPGGDRAGAGGWFPGDLNPGAPVYGREWGYQGWTWPAYGWGSGYGQEYGPYAHPVRPYASGAYGRGGDRAARRWLHRYGYDVELTIRPAPSRGRGRPAMARYR